MSNEILVLLSSLPAQVALVGSVFLRFFATSTLAQSLAGSKASMIWPRHRSKGGPAFTTFSARIQPMSPNLPHIPVDVQRQVLIEAGHRCAVCGVGLPLELAHIIRWSRSKSHAAENLICLCANCHQRTDTECWGGAILRQYKKQPWVIRARIQEVADGVGRRASPPLGEEERRGNETPESFDIFLSHNSKDKPAVRELAEALRARGLRVWLDEWELVPGRPWQEELEAIIETTRSAAVLVGKDGLGPWQNAEMRGFLEEFVNRKLPMIPVLLPDAPEMPSLPFFLKRFTWVDLRAGLTEEGLDLLQWGITGERPDRSKPLQASAATPEAAVTGNQSEVVQVAQRRPRVVVERFRFIAYRNETSDEEYRVEALRVLNLGDAPAVSLRIVIPEFLCLSVRMRGRLPAILRPGDEADIEISNLERLVKSIQRSRLYERGRSVKIPLRVEYRDLDSRFWGTEQAIVDTMLHGIVIEMVHPDEPPEWTDLAALEKAASEPPAS
jgi:nucleotide-binding universal stress UspA family protein